MRFVNSRCTVRRAGLAAGRALARAERGPPRGEEHVFRQREAERGPRSAGGRGACRACVGARMRLSILRAARAAGCGRISPARYALCAVFRSLRRSACNLADTGWRTQLTRRTRRTWRTRTGGLGGLWRTRRALANFADLADLAYSGRLAR
eukprot:gene13793-biopygen3574